MPNRKQKDTLAPSLVAVMAAVLFGASAPLSKLLLAQVEPVIMAGLLYLGSGLAALLVLLARKVTRNQNFEARVTRHDLPYLAGAVAAGGIAAPILLMYGLAGTPAATASLLLNFESVATALIAGLIFREATGRRLWSALALITAGSILLTIDPGSRWGFSGLAFAVLGACFLWGLDNNLTGHISAHDPVTIVAIKGLGAGTVSLLLGLLAGQPLPDWNYFGIAMLLGSLSYGASIGLFVLALRGLGAARTGTLFASAPFIGAVLSFLIFRDSPSTAFWISIPLMVAGVSLLLLEEHEHLHIHEAFDHEHSHRHDTHHRHGHPGSAADNRHSHPHRHEETEHAHVHAPDLHHRHSHEG